MNTDIYASYQPVTNNGASRRRMLLVLIGALVALVVGFFVYSWFVTSTVTITASDAVIVVKQDDKTTTFNSSPAVFKTRSIATVFIEARRSDDGITQRGIVPKRRQNTRIALEVQALARAELVNQAPYIYPLIENNLIFGIRPYNGDIAVSNIIGSDSGALPKLPGLYDLKQILWRDSKNFIYVTKLKGTGVASTQPGLIRRDLPYTAVAAVDADRTALLSRFGLHLSTKGLDIADAPVIAEPRNDTLPFVFADRRFIFYGWPDVAASQDQGKRTSSDEASEREAEVNGTILSIYTPGGDVAGQFRVAIKTKVHKILSLDEQRIVILADDGLYITSLRGKGTRKESFLFGVVKDMALYRNRLLLLGSAGLWEFDSSDETYHKTATYPVGEEYVPYSLAVINNALYFSTSVAKDGFSKNKNAVNSFFRIQL